MIVGTEISRKRRWNSWERLLCAKLTRRLDDFEVCSCKMSLKKKKKKPPKNPKKTQTKKPKQECGLYSHQQWSCQEYQLPHPSWGFTFLKGAVTWKREVWSPKLALWLSQRRQSLSLTEQQQLAMLWHQGPGKGPHNSGGFCQLGRLGKAKWWRLLTKPINPLSLA